MADLQWSGDRGDREPRMSAGDSRVTPGAADRTQRRNCDARPPMRAQRMLALAPIVVPRADLDAGADDRVCADAHIAEPIAAPAPTTTPGSSTADAWIHARGRRGSPTGQGASWRRAHKLAGRLCKSSAGDASISMHRRAVRNRAAPLRASQARCPLLLTPR